ncbi:hypothetical protein AUC70_15855 [Methyloceanibacter stevinii]|uniref:Uncharacterized protein n=1 Tax=Methyloceanibacter stevinii TaxID=1774970 RepID=A0A1E3VSS5_9HYPH|nr:hypothetical protein [Methyloceanibacter stevinii]ODR96351.1 hypothetical protein AUC70_15855 [Methyloceanibacter stevinii]
MSAGYDAEVADLFRDLRAASNLTEADLASRIAAPVEVVQALEQGAIFALPPWPETCRVVSAYGTLLNLDTRPLLRRIYAQLEAGVVELGPKPVQDVPVMVPPAGGHPAAPQGQPAPQAGQPPQGWANGTPQPQQQPAPQQPRPQPQQAAPQLAPAWPSAPREAPQAPNPRRRSRRPVPSSAAATIPHSLGAAAASTARRNRAPCRSRRAHRRHPGPVLRPARRFAAGAPQGAPGQLDTAWPGAEIPGQPVGQPQQPQPAAPQPQADASFPDAGFPGEPQPYPQQPGYAPDPNTAPDPALGGDYSPADDASFPGEPELELVDEEEEEPKSSRSPLLKWGIIGLLAVILLLGLWMVFGGSSGDGGLSSGFNTSDPVLDPDDPRSRKADRLPNNF